MEIEIDQYKYGHLICDQVAKAVQWRKDSSFNKLKYPEKLDIHMQNKMDLNLYLILFLN